jgi:IS5 family transposase
MRPKKHATTGEGDLFRGRLDQIINMRHELVQLAGKVDWDWLDGEIAGAARRFSPGVQTPLIRWSIVQPHVHLRATTVIEVLLCSPAASTATALMVCVPLFMLLPCQVTEQEVVLLHLPSVLPSPIIVIDATLVASLADTAMLIEPFPLITLPLTGEVIATVGGVGAAAGIVIDMDDELAEVPAVL